MENNIKISEAAQKRICEIIKTRNEDSFLRVIIESGGCAGFQSSFKIDNTIDEDDIQISLTYNNTAIKVVIDSVSLDLVKGSTVEFTNSIMGSYFWLNIPNAQSSCGCGSSFSI